MNAISITGRLATDPEQRDDNIVSFIIAVARDAESDDFFNVKTAYSQAEFCLANLKKGNRVAIEGAIRQNIEHPVKKSERNPGVSIIVRHIEAI